MASEVDLCNLALARLGDSATVSSINPPEGSAQAEHCARFYPIARDAVLESHPWHFATRRASLPLLDVPAWGWSFAYGLPNNSLVALAVLSPNSLSDAETQDFDIESTADGARVLYTNQDDATLRYVARVTDTSRFSPGFIEALSWLLASYLAGPLVKGNDGAKMAKSAYQQYAFIVAQAKATDANQRQVDLDHMPEWMSRR
ncbi:MAG: hypothetical protein U5L08_04415 [Xanthomonadales bacterium]|nr:hypothetical protein [Xanthomonadales bacterium]